MSKIFPNSKLQNPILYRFLLVHIILLASLFVVKAIPAAQVDLQQTQSESNAAAALEEEGDALDNEIPQRVETTTQHFLSYLFRREGDRDPWVAQLVKAAAPVLATEGIGGVIRQSFKAGPALALGAFNALANQRIGPLLNLPTVPTTTVIPPYKRYRDSDSE